MGTGCSRFNTLPAVFHFVSAAARSRRLENELEKTKEEAVNEIKLLLLVTKSYYKRLTKFGQSFFSVCTKNLA
jgi:hypothetical protein